MILMGSNPDQQREDPPAPSNSDQDRLSEKDPLKTKHHRRSQILRDALQSSVQTEA